jgi:quinol monooxygenase YgiN
MDKIVYWVIESAIKPGELDNLKTLMKEMVEATKANEPGTINYEWSISEDGKFCHIYERYEDSDATMIHVSTFNEKFVKRFISVMTPTRQMVYGNPNTQVKQALGKVGAKFMIPADGFAR